MLRSKKIVLVSHCILNQNSVVHPLSRAKGAFSFVNFLVESGAGIIQLPCPELRYLGINRKPMDKNEYDTNEYRNLCIQLFVPVLDEIKMYLKNGYSLLGIIGINESPTCSISGNRGIFMEEIFRLLEFNKIHAKYFEVPSAYDDASDCEAVCQKLKQFLA